MYTVVLGLHVFVCVLLIIAVLLQSGKGSSIGAALGGGSSSEVFGPGAPATLMNKVTTFIAIAFLVLSLALALMAGQRNPDSVFDNYVRDVPAQTTPATAETPAE